MSEFDNQGGAGPIEAEVKWYNGRKGFGFVLGPDGTDVFFHASALTEAGIEPPDTGDKLVCEIGTDRQGRRLVTRIVENTLRGQAEFYARLRRDRARLCVGDGVLELDAQQRTGTTPSQHAAKQEEAAWLRLAMDLLEPDDRDLIVLREWSGESFAAIGARFGVPENTARMRFSRAVGRLATQVDLLRRGVV